MAGLFDKPKVVAPPPPKPVPDAAAIEDATRRDLAKRIQSGARVSSQLTAPGNKETLGA